MEILLTGNANPYEPPQSHEQSWWAHFSDLFRSERQTSKRRFKDGYALIYEGIAFYIDPDNRTILYAASPSNDQSESRMNLIVAEVLRLLPEFVARNSHLRFMLKKRKIVIRMINSYADKQAEFIREVAIDWDLLN